MERTPAGQLLIDTHKQAKEMPCNALHWASLRTYTPFAISALNLIYIHFIIFAFSATPTQLRPACSALPCPPLCCLPASLRSDLWQSPLVVFSVTVVPCGANEFKCVRNWVIKISVNSASLPSVPTRFLRGVQAKISLWIWQHFYIFVYFNLWPSVVQFISRAKCKWGENEAW